MYKRQKEIVQRATQKHRGLSYEPKEKFLRKHWFPNEVVDELRMKMTLLVIDCVRLQLGADDASGIILTRAYDMTLKELEWRQAQTKQAEYKASREIKRRIHEAEEAKRRKLEPTVVDGDVGDGDGDGDDSGSTGGRLFIVQKWRALCSQSYTPSAQPWGIIADGSCPAFQAAQPPLWKKPWMQWSGHMACGDGGSQ